MILGMIIMNCRRVNGMISAYIDSELSGMDMMAVRRHLTECDECRREYESIIEVKRAFGALSPKRPADGFTTRIFAHLDEVSIPLHRRIISYVRQRLFVFPPKVKLATAGIAAAAVILSISSGYMGSHNIRTAENTVHFAPYGMANETFLPISEFSSTGSPMVWKEEAPMLWRSAKEPFNPFPDYNRANTWLTDY